MTDFRNIRFRRQIFKTPQKLSDVFHLGDFGKMVTISRGHETYRKHKSGHSSDGLNLL